MALGDFLILEQASSNGGRGSRTYNVAAGATAILAGEPVTHALGLATVTQMTTNKPVVATDFLAGIAETNSTQTAGAAGVVSVWPISNQTTFLANPLVPATFATQALYDALVGDRVLIDLTAGVFTVLATDGATNGAVLQPLDLGRYPGKVAIAFRNGVSDLA